MRSHFFFFFQAEDGIRDKLVTGVQTCALPIFPEPFIQRIESSGPPERRSHGQAEVDAGPRRLRRLCRLRSEEHTSELQSLAYLVCRLLLEKKKEDLQCVKRSSTSAS